MKSLTKFLILFLTVALLPSCNESSTILTVGEKDSAQFSSLPLAIDSARQLLTGGKYKEVTVDILPGTYYLSSPIQVTPELSGLHLKGAGSDVVKIKGSQILTLKWESVDDHVYKASVPEGTDFDQLIVDDEFQILARYPNYNESGGCWNGYAADAISSERIATWAKPEGALFHAMHRARWGGFHYRIVGVDEKGEAILEGGHQNNRPSEPHKEYRMVENVKEELDSPGEWYLDKSTNELFYYPTSSIALNEAKIEVAVIKSLIEFVGDVDAPVKNVVVEGIGFEHTQRTILEYYEQLLRSDWSMYRGAALFFEGTENCLVEACEFSKLGGNVIFASKYNSQLTIKSNHIHDCGASAISFVGDASAVRSPSFTYKEFVSFENLDTLRGPKNELYPRQCIAEDNLIYRIGKLEKQAAGVQIAMAMDITVSHNSIYDVPRAGINIGDGTWGGHVIEFNDVFNTVLETHDHGSFNSWGRDRFWLPNRGEMDSVMAIHPDMYLWDAIHTTTIRNNRFKCDHGWDIDLDDGSSNYHIYNNLCLNRGLKLREGFGRTAENNIMVNNTFHPHVWFANSRDVFRKNIVCAKYKNIRLTGWGKEIDYNLFPTEKAMLSSQRHDRDMNSAYGDPMFVNPDLLDFSVKENSPALALGFVNFPMNEFGVVNAKFKAIAKTPTVILEGHSESKKSSVVKWLAYSLKNIDTEEEQSAYGINSFNGVIVVGADTKASGANTTFKASDVILKVEGKSVKGVGDYLKKIKSYSGSVSMTVVRHQQEQVMRVKID